MSGKGRTHLAGLAEETPNKGKDKSPSGGLFLYIAPTADVMLHADTALLHLVYGLRVNDT